MAPTKTPGGQVASEKFQKKEAQAQGLGAPNAPGHTEGHRPGDAPVASNSYTSSVGVEAGTDRPGEKGNIGTVVGQKPSDSPNQGNMK